MLVTYDEFQRVQNESIAVLIVFASTRKVTRCTSYEKLTFSQGISRIFLKVFSSVVAVLFVPSDETKEERTMMCLCLAIGLR